jgi:hypothetical protein
MIETDELIRAFRANVARDEIEARAIAAARKALRTEIAAEGSRRRHLPRGRFVALFAILAAIGIAVPALGTDWIGESDTAGIRGSADPVLTAPPVVVASGEPGPWMIVVARSDKGLCLNVDVGEEAGFSAEKHRHGDCGYSHIRGALPSDVRGDPSATCIGLTNFEPCGSQPLYSVDAGASGVHIPNTDRSILAGAAAAEVTTVEIQLANGTTLEAEVVSRPLGPDVPLNVYWVELGPEHGFEVRLVQNHLVPCVDNVVEMVIARGADRAVLGRRVPAWNANPTGDPDGAPRPRVTEDRCA